MTTQTLNIENLSIEDKKRLMAELAEDQKNALEKKRQDKVALKDMIDDTLDEVAPQCADFGKKQVEIVDQVFKKFETIVSLKKDLYGFDEKQASHTFTSRRGNSSITIGYNEVPAFDSMVDVGVQKIHKFLGSLSKDDINRVKIEKVVSTLTKKNKKGDLNPTKVIALSDLKADMDDELFSEGVDIVVASQFKTRTTMYVRGWYRIMGESEKEIKLSFSITAV